MANDAGRVRKSLQSAIDQPLVQPAPPRRDDWYVALTVNSPASRHRPQRLHRGQLRFDVDRLLRFETTQLGKSKTACDRSMPATRQVPSRVAQEPVAVGFAELPQCKKKHCNNR